MNPITTWSDYYEVKCPFCEKSLDSGSLFGKGFITYHRYKESDLEDGLHMDLINSHMARENKKPYGCKTCLNRFYVQFHRFKNNTPVDQEKIAKAETQNQETWEYFRQKKANEEKLKNLLAKNGWEKRLTEKGRSPFSSYFVLSSLAKDVEHIKSFNDLVRAVGKGNPGMQQLFAWNYRRPSPTLEMLERKIRWMRWIEAITNLFKFQRKEKQNEANNKVP